MVDLIANSSWSSARGVTAPALDGAKVIIVLAELELGGAERQALLLAEYLRRQQGAQVEVWALSGRPGRVSEICEERGIPWRIVQVPWFVSAREKVRGLMALTWALRHARPDVILPYLIIENVACGLVWRWTGARACIWNQRDYGLGRLGQRAERLAVSRTPWFISNSDHSAKFLIETLGAPAERVRVIHNGVELPPPQSDRAAWRDRLGLSDETFVACMVANLTGYKDHDTLLKAWRHVINNTANAGRSAVLLLAGRLDSLDSTHHQTKALAYDLELGKSVRFLGQVQDVSGVLNASDLAVFSSRSESSPNGVLESMAAGLAVVGTDIPGLQAAVGAAGLEFLAPPGDDEALADRILLLQMDPTLRAKLGAENRLLIRREFSSQQMCERTLEVIRSALGVVPNRARTDARATENVPA